MAYKLNPKELCLSEFTARRKPKGCSIIEQPFFISASLPANLLIHSGFLSGVMLAALSLVMTN